jgi:CPA2 family monovalent cation:H+ antiporter-2
MDSTPLTEFGIVVFLALTVGLVLARFGISASLGFILVGLLLGNSGIHYISSTGVSAIFGELGLIMIMFYLGMEVSVKRLKETGAVSFLLVLVEMTVSFLFGFIVSKFFGLTDFEAFIIGSILIATSTVEAVSFIFEKNAVKAMESRIAMSGLIIQDFVSILVLVFISTFGSTHQFGLAVVNGLIFVFAMFFVVNRISARLFDVLESWGQSNKMVLYALAIGVLVSYVGSFLGISPVLGAYFAGFALSETVYSEKVKKELGLFKNFFILFFFVSFGASVIIPSILTKMLLLGLVLFFGYVILKLLVYGFFGVALGLNVLSSLSIASITMTLGEFGIIIASSAAALNVGGVPLFSNSSDLTLVAFVLIVLTTIVSPFIFERVDVISNWIIDAYPESVREHVKSLGYKARSFEKTLSSSFLHNEWFDSLEKLVVNLALAFSIVYLSFVVNLQGFLTGFSLPVQLSVASLLLILIIWPLYRAVEELKFLVYKVSFSTTSRMFPFVDENSLMIERQVSDLFTSFFISAVGFLSVVIVYLNFGWNVFALLIPSVFTMLSFMYFGKSVSSIFDYYGKYQSVSFGESRNKKILSVSTEFDRDEEMLKKLNLTRIEAREKIQDALRSGDASKARLLVLQLRDEEKALMSEFMTKTKQS